MNDDLISSVKRDKKNWFGLDRTTKFKAVEPTIDILQDWYIR